MLVQKIKSLAPQNVKSSRSSLTWELVRNETLSAHTVLSLNLHFNNTLSVLVATGEALLEQWFKTAAREKCQEALQKH